MCLNWLSRGRGGCFRRRQYIRCAPDRKLEAIPREKGKKTNNIGRPAPAVDGGGLGGRGRQDEEAEHAEKPVRRKVY